MKKYRFSILAILMVGCSVVGASADIILDDWAFNVNGVITEKGDSLSSIFEAGSFDWNTGLGTLDVTLIGAGGYSFTSFFDHEISQTGNTFFNEYGMVTGSAAAGQSWEIDEPGYAGGNIYDHLLAGTLDGLNSVPDSADDDVSMAFGWNFSLDAGETAVISLTLSEIIPAGGTFFLSQMDTDSNESIFFSSTLAITGGGDPGNQPIPEPATMLLFGTSLAGFVRIVRRKRNKL